MPLHPEIQQQVIVLLAGLGHSPLRLAPATRFIEDLHLDWSRLMEVVENLERYFGIDVSAAELHRLRTIQDACTCVESHLMGEKSAFDRLLGLLSF